jgi:anti-anti-sigma factor
MAIQNWSESIVVAELSDDPQFSDEMAALAEQISRRASNVVLNLQAVGYVNSSCIAKLLRLRKQMLSVERRLIVCGANNQVWGVFMVTGLDKIFEFTKDVSTALAKMQLGSALA